MSLVGVPKPASGLGTDELEDEGGQYGFEDGIILGTIWFVAGADGYTSFFAGNAATYCMRDAKDHVRRQQNYAQQYS